MLEVDQLLDRPLRHFGQADRVEHRPRHRQHHVTGVHKRRQHDHHPLGLQPLAVLVHVLDAAVHFDDLGAVHHLPVPLPLQQPQHMPRVGRTGGLHAVAVQQPQRIEHGGGLGGRTLAGHDLQGVAGRLFPVPVCEQHGKARVPRRLVLKVRRKAEARHRVDEAAEVDHFLGAKARDLAHRLLLAPLDEPSSPAPVRALESVDHVVAKPLHDLAQKAVRLLQVGLLGVSRRNQRQVRRCGVARQRFVEGLVATVQSHEHLVGLLLVLEPRRLVGLDEVQVEVPRRHGGGTLVGRPEEQVAAPRRLSVRPNQLVFPNLVAGDVSMVGALHDPAERVVVVAVQLGGVQSFGASLDQGVVVVGLFQVQVVLAVVGVRRYELAAHRLVYLVQDGLDLRQEVVGWVASQVLDAGLVQTEGVPQLLCRGAQVRVYVAGCEPVHRERVDDPHRHRHVLGPRVRLPDARLQHFAALNDVADVGHCAERRVLAQRVPVAVVGDESRVIRGQLFVEQRVHCSGEGLEDLALLGLRHLVEGVDVGGVHREEVDVLVHALVHAFVELGKGSQVLAYLSLLVRRLLQQALRHYELHVALGDEHLLEAVLDPSKRLGRERKRGSAEDRFLHAGHEAEAQVAAHFAHFPHEVQVVHQLLVLARPQVVQKLVHNEQETVVGEDAVERRHHLLEAVLVAAHFVGGREGVVDAHGGRFFLQRVRKDVAQGHLRRPDLHPNHLEAARDVFGGLRQLRMREALGQLRVLGDPGQHRHEVGLARAVVADHQQAPVVGGSVVLKLGDHHRRQLLRHLVGHHVGLDQLPSLVLLRRVAKLHNGLDGVELDQVAVLHRRGSWRAFRPWASTTIASSAKSAIG